MYDERQKCVTESLWGRTYDGNDSFWTSNFLIWQNFLWIGQYSPAEKFLSKKGKYISEQKDGNRKPF